jgi:3-isopropylmalate/(R)-2-methylmalate dehydratase small subunit
MRVWKIAGDVDAEQLAPAATLGFGVEVTARHCLQTLRPEFASQVQRGDVLVCESAFGVGAPRERAASVLVHLGVAAVIAPSYSGRYFRKAFNAGLLLLTCAQADRIDDAETIEFDARAGRLTRANAGVPEAALRCEPIPAFLLEMVEAGGLMPQLRRRLAQRVP